MVLDDWHALLLLVSTFGARPPKKHSERTQLWHKMSKLPRELDPQKPDDLPDSVLIEYGFHYEILPSYGKSADGFYAHAPGTVRSGPSRSLNRSPKQQLGTWATDPFNGEHIGHRSQFWVACDQSAALTDC